MPNFNRASVVLAVNRALWGEITPEMRMVVARIAKGAFQIRIVIDGKISKDGLAAARQIGAAVQTGDLKELDLDCQPVRLDAPAPLTVEEGWIPVYQRREA